MAERDLPKDATYDPAAARYILTLRYNPLLEPALQAVGPPDMRPARSPLQSSLGAIESLAVEALDGMLHDMPDARVAVSLSGGVDSTLVLGLLRRHFPDLNVRAISVRFVDGYDETEAAARTAEHVGVNHTIVDVDNYVREMPAAVSAAALPMWDLHWYHVARQAAVESADILISGDGGDELFGGYTFRYEGFLAECGGLSSPEHRARAYLRNHRRDYVPDQANVFGPRMKFSWDDIWRVLSPHFDNRLEPLEQVFLADYNGKLLYNFAHVSSAMSRRFGIPTASPLLSSGMILYAMGVRADEKYDAKSGVGKLPLRALLRAMNLDHLVSDSKAGFSPDTVSYWRRHGYDACAAYLEDARTIHDGWINGEWILRNLSRNIQDVRYVNKFLGLLAFEVWYRIFITGDLGHEASIS